MITRDELTRFLEDLYQYQTLKDFTENGLQVEGKSEIRHIAFGVSFNLPFLEKAIEANADAIIVHHGIFQQGNFTLKNHLKPKIKKLLEHEISLFGIHLPMDSHPDIGHNALLMKSFHAENPVPFDYGFIGENIRGYSLERILDQFHTQLHPEHYTPPPMLSVPSYFRISSIHGFQVLLNGPETPKKIAIISGGSSFSYETAVAKGVDTFLGGDIKEHIPSISYETHTNFVNLGHYFSEKPGVLALMEKISSAFDVTTGYIEIPNPI